MHDRIQSKLALFATNARTVKKEFLWQNNLTKRLAALLYAQEDLAIDCDAVRRCHTLVKQNTGAFSAFRGDMALYVAAMSSLAPDPQGLLSEALRVYDLLKGAKLRASSHLVVAAYQIAAQADPSRFQNTVTRTRAFYDGMKARHFFHTGPDDYIFAAMLGLSDLDVAEGTERIERLYRRLKGEFWDKNSVQGLAQVLALGRSDDAVQRVLALRDMLRASKIKMDKSYTLPTLGILALLPVEANAVVREIGDAQGYLRAQKGFGAFSVTTQEILLFAAAFVAGAYAQNLKDGVLAAALSTSVVNIIIAQQAAMIAAITASTTAAASSS